MPYSVVVSYPADWYFEQDTSHIDRWIEKYMKRYGITPTGSGMGFGERDVSGESTNEQAVEAFALDISCYPEIEVASYHYED